MKLHYQRPKADIIPPAFRRMGRRPRKGPRRIGRVLVLLLAAGLALLWWKKPWVGRSKTSALPTNQPRTSPAPVPVASPPKPAVAPPAPELQMATQPDHRAIAQLQLGLVRAGFSPGPIDGIMGSQTRSALRAFQRQQGLRAAGTLDAATRQRLEPLQNAPFTNYVITADDLRQLAPVGRSWLAKSEQSGLYYENVVELIAERFQTHQNLVWKLNPAMDWDNIQSGTSVIVPAAALPIPSSKAAEVKIWLTDRVLQVFDETGRIMAHFPCSIASNVDKRPLGTLHVTALVPNPNYTFDPAIYPESSEARGIGRKLIIQPGPNNPVGTVWIGLDRPGYGIHGTPLPEKVGRTESHGCFRLANWNAEYLLKMAWVGLPVVVEQ